MVMKERERERETVLCRVDPSLPVMLPVHTSDAPPIYYMTSR
jgi:hypothetical protein